MTELFPELKSHVSTTALLGYLNFSDGKPDPKWQQEMHRTCAWLLSQNVERWWSMLSQWLRQELQTLHQGESTAFRDIAQAELVLTTFEETLPAYREHHSILLAHLSEEELFQPFFLIRVLEAVLSETTVEAALKQLNDFVGYRPIATLETRSEARSRIRTRDFNQSNFTFARSASLADRIRN